MVEVRERKSESGGRGAKRQVKWLECFMFIERREEKAKVEISVNEKPLPYWRPQSIHIYLRSNNRHNWFTGWFTGWPKRGKGTEPKLTFWCIFDFFRQEQAESGLWRGIASDGAGSKQHVYVANNSYQFYIAGHFHYLNTVMEPQPSLASGKNVYVCS